jgi:hypothetical protein
MAEELPEQPDRYLDRGEIPREAMLVGDVGEGLIADEATGISVFALSRADRDGSAHRLASSDSLRAGGSRAERPRPYPCMAWSAYTSVTGFPQAGQAATGRCASAPQRSQ